MIKGTIRINEDKGFYVEYSPKNVYSNYGSENITKTFYQELILNPFKDNSKYKHTNPTQPSVNDLAYGN